MIEVTRDKLNANISPTTPVRVLNTSFQPSVDRPVYIAYTIEISITSTLLGLANRAVELRSDASNPPTTVRGVARNQLSGVLATNLQQVQLSYIVPKGHFVNIVIAASNGTGSVSIISQTETLL